MGVLNGWLSAWIARRFKSEDGATAVEYALMIALIALVIVVAVAYLGQQTNSVYDNETLKTALT
jgi:pilus assembly protein Flp/PilA